MMCPTAGTLVLACTVAERAYPSSSNSAADAHCRASSLIPDSCSCRSACITPACARIGPAPTGLSTRFWSVLADAACSSDAPFCSHLGLLGSSSSPATSPSNTPCCSTMNVLLASEMEMFASRVASPSTLRAGYDQRLPDGSKNISQFSSTPATASRVRVRPSSLRPIKSAAAPAAVPAVEIPGIG